VNWTRKVALVLLGTLLLAGCAGMFARHGERHGRSSSLVEFLYPGGTPPAAVATPVLELPLAVGVAFLPPAQGHMALLDEADKARILEKVRQRFAGRAFVREIVPIPDYYLSGQRGFEGLAALQRLYGLDLVALLSYDQVARQQGNELSLAYLTIVGAYLFPGTSQDVNTLVDMAVVHPATRSLVLRAAGMDSRQGISTEVRAPERLRERGRESLLAAADRMVENFDAELAAFEGRVRQGTARVEVVHAGGGGSLDLLLLILAALAVALRLAARVSFAHADLRLQVPQVRQ
jgi:rhombotail lipoprotein